MKSILKTGFIVTFIFAMVIQPVKAQTSDAAKRRPNVIIVLADDQGYGDLSVHGNPVLKTPVLDQLHSNSIRFHNFHVTPMCTPTRGELMTGHDAMDNGATMVNQGRSMMRVALPTMAGIFKKSGYNTAHFGKWHLGDSYPHRPQDNGFELSVHVGAWGIGSVADYYTNDHWDDKYWHNGKLQRYQGYSTNVWFNLAIDYIKKQAKNDFPFFIYLATDAAHFPHNVDDSYSGPYYAADLKPAVAKFYGQIANIDENMGRLLTTLDETGLAQNTILIYMTDNGSVLGYKVYNAGMRGHKTSMYEGGHRVPMFIRWPNGNIGSPRTIGNVLTRVTDILPTLIDLCHLQKPQKNNFDGRSLAPLLRGNNGAKEKLKDRMFVIQYDNPYRPKENKVVLWKDWRLVKNTELYNLSEDPRQKHNVAEKNLKIKAKMLDHYDRWKAHTTPDYNKPRYIYVGSPEQNPVMLYSSDWLGDYADGLWNLIDGDDTGKWRIKIMKNGTYKMTLYRWPPASETAMNAPYDVAGKQQGGAIPVAWARLKVGNISRTVKIPLGASKVQFMVDLKKGPNFISTRLLDKNKKILCSAYYVKVELIR